MSLATPASTAAESDVNQIVEAGKELVNSIMDSGSFINDLSSRYVLKPLGAKGIAGFVFDINDETRIDLKAQITDHFIEDNTTIQDHIAINPEIITLRGFVGEVVFAPTGVVNNIGDLAVSAFAEFVDKKLTNVAAFLPQFNESVVQDATNSVNADIQATNDITEAANRLENIVEIALRSTVADSRQQRAYMILKSLWRTRQIFTVQTPYEYFRTCAIQSIAVMQDAETNTITDFTVTLKKLNFTELSFVALNDQEFSGRTAQQRSGVVKKGKTKGEERESSFLFQLLNPDG